MLFMNQKMLNIVSKEYLTGNTRIADKIINDIVDNTILKNECLLYDKDGQIRKAPISIEWIKENFSDLIGYEVTINELKFDKESFSDINLFYFMYELSNKFEMKFSKKIVSYISLHESDIDIRFHTFRTDETDWLCNDLDCYDNPIMCKK